MTENKENNVKDAKKCITCNIIKSLKEFAFRNDTNKYRNQCKVCRLKEGRIYSQQNRKKNNERAKQHYIDNHEYKLEYARKNYSKQKNKGRFGGNRFIVLERDGYKCQKCGATKNLVVHHIDKSGKDWGKDTNNNLDNLQTLCKSCHTRLHHRKYFGCLVEGCDAKHHAKGYCSKHQKRRKDLKKLTQKEKLELLSKPVKVLEKEGCHTLIYSRITGYYSPHIGWNKGKIEELSNRKKYNLEPKLDPERPATFDKTEEYPPIEKEGWK